MPFRYSNLALATPFAIATGALLLICAPGLAHAQAAGGVDFSVLHAFGPADTSGINPQGTPAIGQDGDVYGTTQSAVFKSTLSGDVSTVFSFSGGGYGQNTTGENPVYGLTAGSDGNFYGVTAFGGPTNEGVIYQVTPVGVETVLHDFVAGGQYTDIPTGGLTQGPNGSFYGVLQQSETSYNGSIYKVSPTGTYSIVHSFAADGSEGSAPQGKVAFDSAGNLYGVTRDGGANNGGTIYEIIPNGTLTTLYGFDYYSGGSDPLAGVTLGSDGNLYGTTGVSLNGYGTVYKFDLASGTLTTLHEFDVDGSSYGQYPRTELIQGSNGYLYGTTEGGGFNGDGTVFQVTTTGVFTRLYAFGQYPPTGSGNIDGNDLEGGLAQSSDGSLYGLAKQGGPDGFGTLYKIVSSRGSGERFDFNGDGRADLIWYNTDSGSVSAWDMSDQTILQFGSTFAQLDPSSGWVPVAAPDVNGDGYPDLLWWNKNTGEMSVWTLQNTTVLSYGADFATLADTTWKPVAVADNNGSTWELVFQNTASGDISRWLMNGTTVIDYGGTIASFGAHTPYRIVGAPDLDGDGYSDLLIWNNKTGGVSYWSMDLASQQVLAYHGDFAQVPNVSWRLVGSEDTNGDGYPDLLWWNSATGEVSRWLLNGTTVEQYGGDTVAVPDTSWQPTAIR